MTNYKIVNETCYHSETPDELIQVLEKLRQTKQRVAIWYGNTNTGAEWEAPVPERGTIGRSTGTRKIPLLVKTSRSLGGEALLTHCIVKITESSGSKRLLYQVPSSNG